MTCFHRSLTMFAVAMSLALPPAGIAAAQMGPRSQPPAASDQDGSGSGPGYRHGYGPGMMWGWGAAGPGARGGGWDRGMMWGYGPGMMFGGGWGPGMMWGYGGPGIRSGENFAEGQLAFLKTELKITPQQMPLWDKYADSVRQSAKTMYEQHRSLFDRDWSRASLPERLDGREQMIALRLETLKATDSALKPLYAALDKEQKEIADQFLGGPMGGPFGFM